LVCVLLRGRVVLIGWHRVLVSGGRGRKFVLVIYMF
jgi:hypothetical protein